MKIWITGRSAIAVPQLFLVRNSAVDLVVCNIAELRATVADAHLCLANTMRQKLEEFVRKNQSFPRSRLRSFKTA
jgi:hypothetical protein